MIEILDTLQTFLIGMVLFLVVCGFLVYPFGSDNKDDRRSFDGLMRAVYHCLLGVGWLFIFEFAYIIWNLQ